MPTDRGLGRAALKPTYPKTLFQSFALEGQILLALIMREMHTRYGRENLGFLWVMAEPLLFGVAVAFLWGAMKPAYEHGIGVFTITVSGYMPMVMWRGVFSRSVLAFRANAALMYHQRIRLINFVTSRVVIEVFGVILAYVIASSLFIFIGLMDWPTDLGPFYAGWLLHIYWVFATGVFVSAVSEMSDFIEKVTGLLSYIYIPLSGAFFMVDWLPAAYRPLALLMPSVHAYEIMREGLLPPGYATHYDVVYAVSFCTVLLLVGLLLLRRAPDFMRIN
ncbi:ABC transporter permease [Zavarzinia compransoris]|uniref:ABC-2 type transporter transmembrane domain-containing protein n=1 Tax=Zavarzinia compransoris TaxID=1264899 RepID=A0A317DXV0_9PROT|nr:ABC transporter permease [Zavarzinia compransoris]PWR19557.1 hypothetical protein DKG75_13855 [Zavarzinia compransoris]TDP40898.1 capsular polysaccharide transport system permease protein [Zavarzinia compransoris]